MATVTVTKDNFESLIEGNDVVVLDFWADWCAPCKRFAPIFEAASETHTGVLFGKVDTQVQQELAGAFGIRSIPTTVFYRQQIPLHMQPGLLPAEALEDLLKQVQELDMDVVRAEEIAKREAEEAGGAAEA